MSLLSLKNFKGPFANPVHLVTILLITVAFGVFRWSNGGLSFGSGAARPAQGSAGEESRSAAKSTERPAADNRAATTKPASKNVDLLGDMLREPGAREPQKNVPKPGDKKNGRDAGLEDIEKTLGLK